MSWNRPSENGEAVSRPLQKRKGFRFPIKSVIAWAVVALGAAVAAWWLWPTGETRQDVASTKKALIKEVTPAKATKAEPAPEKKKDPPGYYNGKKISESNRPPWMSPYHRIIDYGPIHTNKPREKTLIEKTFERTSDQQIADLLDTEPGTMFVGDCPDLYKNFTKRFLKSMETPIIVTSEDTEEVKELKRAVIKARLELKDRYDRGEDLNKFMMDSRNALKELGLYKDELNRQLESISKDNVLTEEEAADYVKAANKMLEERGCSPLGNTEFLASHLHRRSKAWETLKKMKEEKK